MRRAINIFGVIWLQVAVYISTAAAASPSGKRPAPVGTVIAIPSFSASTDSPEFLISFTNTSFEPTDARNVLMFEAVQLDGHIYPRLGVKLAGSNAVVRPGKSWSHTVAVSEFLPGSQRLQYSDALKRWRWRVPLKSGKHTIIFHVGNSKSVEMAFAWNGEGPILRR